MRFVQRIDQAPPDADGGLADCSTVALKGRYAR
jgi:hypothetical protein